MSYPPVSGYYGSSSGSQNDHRGYSTTGEADSRSNPYQSQVRGVDDNRQNQYNSSAYNWSGQSQNAAMTNAQQGYGNEAWQDRSNTSSTYPYQREHYASTEQMNSQNQPYTARDTYNSQNTQGLNSLAYASGLEPTTAMTNNIRTSHTASQSPYNPSAHMRAPQIRTASPANTNARYPTGSTQSSQLGAYSMQNDNSASVHNHNLAVNAAAALASTVRGVYPQTGQHVNNTVTNRASNSPMPKQSHPVMQKTLPQTTTSYNVGPPTGHQKKASTQSQSHNPPVGTANQSQSKPFNSARKSFQPEQQRASQHPQPQRSNQQSPVQNRLQQTPNPNPQDIANLVNDTTEDPDQVHESVETQEPMPHYIDPSQVFNPYHREHERKKKEAAEAEARRKVEEQRLAEEKRKAADDAAKKSTEPSATANSKSKITKKSSAIVSKPKTQSNGQPSADVATAPPSEDMMAVELQKMMSKMKEFRTSNPALFQKLWNDMRGGASAASSSAALTVQSPPPQPNQAPASTPSERTATPAKARPRKVDHLTPDGHPLNGYRVVVEDNPEGLPDLGRFPAERRIRQSYNKQKPDTNGDELIAPEQTLPLHNESFGANIIQNQPPPTSTRPLDPAVTWPEPRRRAVAIAAVHYLKSIPENQHSSITAQEICSLLERNPSYLDLCTALESQGLKFQKTVFARELLRGVPELQTPASKATPATKGMASISSAANAQSPSLPPAAYLPADMPQPAPQPLQNLFANGENVTPASHAPPIFTGLTALKAEQPTPSSRTSTKPVKGRSVATGRFEPPPGTKEAAARKRDFAELIDLTAIGEDDNYVLPTEQPRLDETVMIDPFKQIESSIRSGFNVNSSEPLRFNPQVEHPPAPPPPPPPLAYPRPFDPQPTKSPFPTQNVQQNNNKPRVLLAKKLDKAEAMKKLYYDPRTVARDVLISSGRHSSERPLNLHLAGFIKSFIDLDCDVSTFDWDTVDPGGPPLPKVDYVDVLAAPPRFKLGERVVRRRKRAKLTDIENTRDPEKERRRSPSAVHDLEPTQTKSRTQLLPFTQTLKFKGSEVEQKLLKRKRSERDVGTSNDSTRLTPASRNISVDIPLNSQQSIRSASHQLTEARPHMDLTPNTKRRGRPPGSKNKYPSVASMKQQAKSVTINLAKPLEQPPEPLLHTYKCKWVKCQAELHNLDTLKRHVATKHSPPESVIQQDGFVCWWKKCQFLEQDGDVVAPARIFQNRDEWLAHINEDHIQPIALRYGDGPQTKHTGKQIPRGLDLSKFLYEPQVGPLARTVSYLDPQSVEMARSRYLADPDGRATTPLVTPDGNPEHPPDAMVLTKSYPHGPKSDKEKADITAQNAFMKAHGNRQQDAKKAAEEVIRAMEVRKQKIGPGLDRGGCTLINEARRSTLIQAPGISRIVDADY